MNKKAIKIFSWTMWVLGVVGVVFVYYLYAGIKYAEEHEGKETAEIMSPQGTPEFIEHIVQKGESINAIARKYTVLPWQLRAANGMTAEDTLLHPGDVMYVPKIDWSSRTYVGKASWYGPNFHGKKRADGEVYDQHEILVAHRTLPLGIFVKIVNLQNGKTIVAEIKDRGPYTKDEKGRYKREIDLSRGAAKKLGALEPGVIPVKIQPLG